MCSEETNADQWRPDTYWDGGGDGNFVEGYTRGIGMAPGASPEVLPKMADGEVEIVLIRMRSVLGDLMSLRARCEDGRIRYRMVDEYDLSRELVAPQDELPLTFGELTHLLWTFRRSDLDEPFFLSGWRDCLDSLDVLGWDGVGAFYSLTSEFYEGVEGWYESQFEQWAAAERAEWDCE